jgi:hypothetical protein
MKARLNGRGPSNHETSCTCMQRVPLFLARNAADEGLKGIRQLPTPWATCTSMSPSVRDDWVTLAACRIAVYYTIRELMLMALDIPRIIDH